MKLCHVLYEERIFGVSIFAGTDSFLTKEHVEEKSKGLREGLDRLYPCSKYAVQALKFSRRFEKMIMRFESKQNVK